MTVFFLTAFATLQDVGVALRGGDGYPTVAAVIAGFALLCALAILNVVGKLYVQSIKHAGLPAKMDALAAEIRLSGTRFDAHCMDEEKSRTEIRDQLVRAANVAHAALLVVQQDVNIRFDQIDNKLTERRITRK